jgi:hypothetical protein
MNRDINRSVSDRDTGRVLAKKIVILPVLRRSDGSLNEAATTVWTNIAQHLFHARGTECTFIGADACLK